MRLLRVILSSILTLPLSACVTWQTTRMPPHVNVSPKRVDLAPVANGGGVSIGVEAEPNESDSLDNLEVLPGTRVAAVEMSGPAALAGLRAGDVILSADGLETNDPEALEALVRGAAPGDRLTLEVRRDTVVFEATVVARGPPADTPPPRELYRVDPLKTRAGYRTEVVNVDGVRRTAARVVRLFAGSPLPAARVAPGDLVLEIAGEPISSAQDLVRRLLENHEPGARVPLGLLRDGTAVPATVRLRAPPRRLSGLAVLPLFRYDSQIEPSRTEFALLDLWICSLFSYRRDAGEREYRIFSIIRWSTGHGALLEEPVLPGEDSE